MSRKPREISPICTYHVIMRGVAKHNIFTCDEDKERFKETMFRFADELKIGIISYILMDNHVHIQLRELGSFSCSVLVRKICTSYVRHYFNPKYDRCGALFQPRYNRCEISTNEGILNVCRYIHQNALVQNLPNPFRFTSYGEILEAYDKKCPNKAIFIKPIEKLINKRAFKDMVKKCDKLSLMTEDYTLSDNRVRMYICASTGIESVGFLHTVEEKLRNSALKNLAENGITLKRLERITCLSKPELRRICFG